jgi:hypothetical protein
MKECKRLAEVDFPIAVVSRHSAREKSIRHGHPSNPASVVGAASADHVRAVCRAASAECGDGKKESAQKLAAAATVAAVERLTRSDRRHAEQMVGPPGFEPGTKGL